MRGWPGRTRKSPWTPSSTSRDEQRPAARGLERARSWRCSGRSAARRVQTSFSGTSRCVAVDDAEALVGDLPAQQLVERARARVDSRRARSEARSTVTSRRTRSAFVVLARAAPRRGRRPAREQPSASRHPAVRGPLPWPILDLPLPGTQMMVASASSRSTIIGWPRASSQRTEPAGAAAGAGARRGSGPSRAATAAAASGAERAASARARAGSACGRRPPPRRARRRAAGSRTRSPSQRSGAGPCGVASRAAARRARARARERAPRRPDRGAGAARRASAPRARQLAVPVGVRARVVALVARSSAGLLVRRERAGLAQRHAAAAGARSGGGSSPCRAECRCASAISA